MRKRMLAALGMCLLLQATAFAQSTRTIPYQPGQDILSEGASAAGKELNHPHSPYYGHQDFYKLKASGSLLLLPNFATYQQSREHTCGPAAALMVLNYYGVQGYTEMSVAEAVHAQGYPIGTNCSEMVKFFQGLGWQVEANQQAEVFASTAEFKSFVQKQLQAKHPLIVENIRWGGHWYVIIGYDDMGTATTLDDVLICADSYDTDDHQQDGYSLQNVEQFFSTWFDRNNGKREPMLQTYIVAYPQEPVRSNKAVKD